MNVCKLIGMWINNSVSCDF